MLSQTSGFKESAGPPREEIDAAVKRAFKDYPQVKYDESRWLAKAKAAVRNLKPDASPGFPLAYKYKTNKAALEALGDEYFVELTMARLHAIKDAPRCAFDEWTPSQLVDNFLCDPIRVFVKSEVHSSQKIEEGRMRLIMSVSVIDQMVERVLDSDLNGAEKDVWETIHSKPGMGLHDSGLSSLEQQFLGFADPAGTDARGWDMGVQQWQLDADADRRAMQAGLEGNDTMYHRRARLLGFAVLVLSGGKVYEQVVRGIQKSGAYTTSSSNSGMRVLCCALVTPREYPMGVCAMGDDCVEDIGWIPPDVDALDYLADAYRKVDVNIKEVERYSERSYIEFCAYRFDLDGGYIPIHWDKMLATFLVTWPQEHMFEERMLSLEHEFRHSPQWCKTVEVLSYVAEAILGEEEDSRNSQD